MPSLPVAYAQVLRVNLRTFGLDPLPDATSSVLPFKNVIIDSQGSTFDEGECAWCPRTAGWYYVTANFAADAGAVGGFCVLSLLGGRIGDMQAVIGAAPANQEFSLCASALLYFSGETDDFLQVIAIPSGSSTFVALSNQARTNLNAFLVRETSEGAI